MSTWSDRCYELLGVRPGVSVQELKAAYRDLAKVWHPDRFTHDPRLQQKAEEKLKEINDAYEQLLSGKTPRPTVTQSDEPKIRRDSYKHANFHSGRAAVKSRSLIWFTVPLIIFGAVFIFTIRSLNRQNNEELLRAVEQNESATVTAPEVAGEPAVSKSLLPTTSSPTDVKSELQPVPTTTVMIDSTTGLLAREECPTKIRMTYPSGSEPRAYCSGHRATPTNPQNQSKLKSLEKKAAGSSEELDESEKIQP